MKIFKKLFSNLEANIITFTVFLLLVFSILVSVIGYGSFTTSFEMEYDHTTYHMADIAAGIVNGDEIDLYLNEGADNENYQETKLKLDTYCIKMDVSLIYVIKVDTSDYKHFISVFNCVGKDTPYTEWELGSEHDTTNDEYREIYRRLYEGSLNYGTIYRTDNLRGAPPHITTLVPLKNSKGETVSVLCVQRMMNRMVEARRPYLIIIACSTAALMLLSIIVTAFYLRRQIIRPIHKIIREAKRFAAENKPGEKLGADISYIEDISVLATSIDKMEEEMLRYVDNLTVATAEKERIGTELSLATAIQANSLPNTFPAFPDRNDFDIYASMTPAKEVGGDFYDFFLIDDDHLALVIADVSGKGIPAALFMMVTKILVNEVSHFDGSPAEVLRAVNERICKHNPEDMFVTVWLGFLELSTGRMICANAGHDDPAVMRKNGDFELLKSRHGFVIGAMDTVKYRDAEFTLSPGDKLFLYTDGVPEATDKENQLLTIDGMLKALNQHKEKDPQGIIEGVIQSVNDFVGEAPQFDDITMVCLEMKGEAMSFRLIVDAQRDELEKVNDFIHQHLDDTGFPMKEYMQLDLAVEEIFVNIATYAYEDGKGTAEIILSKNNDSVSLTFIDQGVPYDPLAKPDPDTTLSASERQIGGLGIFLVKKVMDETFYEYKDGSNIFTMVKKLK
ncbi:MAG TPA: hypothetical protein DCY72_04760 [Ruminococcaceae bacterium]|nr:hypothetical protein [Oscillospiraceae bacterium]